MKYRSRMEIIRIILEITSNGATKTKIMYNAYLSYAQLCEYISFLVENKLINRAAGSELYRLTEKGQKVYLKCKELDQLIGSKEIEMIPFGTKDSSYINEAPRHDNYHG